MDKVELIRSMKALLDERMQVAWAAMEAAQESANDQGKSSMGDKYETSRSMGQLDRNMHARQYEQIRQERLVLERIAISETPERVAVGSLLQTSAGWFFVSVSLGAIKLAGENILAISSASPVGGSLLGKNKGDSFRFLNKDHSIIALM